MGILDDAIREHLDLKRRHGVPEDEVQRQEEEALGPTRREVAQEHAEVDSAPGQTATAEAEQPPEAADGGAGETAIQEPPAVERTAIYEAPAVEGPPAADEQPAAEDSHPDEPAEPHEAVDAVEAVEPAPVEPTPAEPPPVEPPPVEPAPADPILDEEEPVGEPGHEPEPADEEDPLAADPEDDDLDVLEDTPDFLQETPEHDRLWFEQKPPRDFDFD